VGGEAHPCLVSEHSARTAFGHTALRYSTDRYLRKLFLQEVESPNEPGFMKTPFAGRWRAGSHHQHSDSATLASVALEVRSAWNFGMKSRLEDNRERVGS
jgi:hypothetical protein